MKRIKYIIFILFMFMIFNINTYAYTLEKKPIDNLWYLRKGGGKEAFSAQFMEYFIDGKVTYCIEPGEHITTNEYILYTDDYEIERKVILIGYYGYGYGNHTTLRHKMATQSLIWELVSGQIVEYWTKPSGAGEYISVNKEKQEIMNLVNIHKNLPIFDTTYKDVEVDEEVIFVDKFDTLNNFEIINNPNARIEDNKVIYKATKVGSDEILLRRKIYSNNKFLIYEGIDKTSQKMAYFGGVDEYVNIKLNVIGGNILINKTNENGEFIKDVEFELYKDNELIDTFKTTNETYKISNLKYGNYCVKEINAPEEYEIDNKLHCFTLDSEEKIISLTNNYKKIINEVKGVTEEKEIVKEIIDVPITYLDKNYNYLFLLLISISLIIYEKKNINI